MACLHAAGGAAGGGPASDAATRFSDASYPILQKIDWGNTPSISKYSAMASARLPMMMGAAFDWAHGVGLRHLRHLQAGSRMPRNSSVMQPTSFAEV